MARSLLLAILFAATLWFGGGRLVRSFASDATRVRWAVESMERGYERNRLQATLAPIAADWRHEGSSEVSRGLLADVLRHRFFNERDPQTRERLDRVRIDWDTWSVEIEGDVARAEFELDVEERRGEAWELAARARIEAEFQRRPEGWKLARSGHSDLEGRLR